MAVTIAGSGTVTGVDPDSFETGLRHIVTKDFSAVSSVSVDGCFTSEFDNYRVVMHLTSASTIGSAYLRLRASGADLTTSAYHQMSPGLTSTNSTSNNGQNAATNWEWGTINSAGVAFMAIDVLIPNVTEPTRIGGSSAYYNGTNFVGRAIQGVHDNSTAIDGFTFYAGSGTWTGTLRVYGYMNGVAA